MQIFESLRDFVDEFREAHDRLPCDLQGIDYEALSLVTYEPNARKVYDKTPVDHKDDWLWFCKILRLVRDEIVADHGSVDVATRQTDCWFAVFVQGLPRVNCGVYAKSSSAVTPAIKRVNQYLKDELIFQGWLDDPDPDAHKRNRRVWRNPLAFEAQEADVE